MVDTKYRFKAIFCSVIRIRNYPSIVDQDVDVRFFLAYLISKRSYGLDGG